MYFFPQVMLNPGKLSQGHQKLNKDCTACHTVFNGLSTTKCISCHKLSEIGTDTGMTNLKQSGKKKILFHEKLLNTECTDCHTDHKGLHPGIKMMSFNHDLLSVADRGKCSSCHNKPANELHRLLDTNCGSCHNSTDWKEGTIFSHGVLAAGSLNNCGTCHNKPDDNLHRVMSQGCISCHDTTHWKPSSFNHTNYFVLDRDHNVNCETCHSGTNFKEYSCYGCHEHSPAKIESEHREEGISNFSNCVKCHKSADEHDIRTSGEGNRSSTMDEQDKAKAKTFISKEGSKGKEKDDD